MRTDAKSDYKLGTFSVAGCDPFPGLIIEDKHVLALSALDGVARLRGTESMIGILQDWEANSAELRKVAPTLLASRDCFPFADVASLKVHAPLAPNTVVCAGFNYRKHVLDWYEDPKERQDMADRLDARARGPRSFVFSKSTAAVTDPVTTILLPRGSIEVDWEVELVAVIGRMARLVSRSNALDHVAGYTVANDISARDFLSRADISPGLFDFFGSKSSSGFCPLGPYIVPAEFIPDPQTLWLKLRLNGEVMQDEGTEDMIDNVAKLIEYASSRTTLRPGDVLLTGSPSGNAKFHGGRYLRPGDVIETEIFGVGRQKLAFVDEPTA